jgi:MFS family permease
VSELEPGFGIGPNANTVEPPGVVVMDRSPKERRIAVTVVFFLVGTVAGTWASRIPAVKSHLHLSAGVLGLTLLGPAVGAVIAMGVVGAVLVKVKPRRVVGVMFVPYGLFLAATAFVDSPWELFLALVGWGAAVGSIDVAMNIEAAALQDLMGRRIMSRFHAAYSLGGLAGAGFGALAAATGLGVTINFPVVGLLALVIGVAASSIFSRTPMKPALDAASTESAPIHASRRPKLSWSLIGLAMIAFGCFLAEGAVNNWSAVYLHSSLKASAGLAAVAYTAFSCAMAAGRLCGDHLAERFGPVRLVRISAGLATIGMAAALVAGQVVAAMAGFILLGLGMSFVVPLVFTASSQQERPGPSLAMVNSSGYIGLLVGPPLIGGIADALGLPSALGVIVAITALTAVIAGVVAPRRRLGATSTT